MSDGRPTKMNLPQRVVDKIVDGLLGSLDGWKTIIGLVLIVGIMVANQQQWISQEMADKLYPWAVSVFGVGIVHKQVKRR